MKIMKLTKYTQSLSSDLVEVGFLIPLDYKFPKDIFILVENIVPTSIIYGPGIYWDLADYPEYEYDFGKIIKIKGLLVDSLDVDNLDKNYYNLILEYNDNTANRINKK